MEAKIFSPELLKEIRDKFVYIDWDPYTGKRIHIEASGGSARLISVIDTYAKETCLPSEHHRGNPASNHADEVFEKGMEDIKIFVGGESGQIMPALSGSQAIFLILNTVTNHIPGKNIVTTQLEHPSNLDGCRYLADLRGLELRVAKLSRKTSSIPIDSILEKIDKDTCLLSFVHASNVTGAVHDVGTVVKEARKINPDLYVVVDAVQYTPHGPIDVEEWGVDGYTFSPYKAYCVKGCGFGYLSDRLAKLPHWKLAGKPEADWVLGSPGHQIYGAFSAMIDYLCWLGSKFSDSHDRRELLNVAKQQIYQHMMALSERILKGTDNIDGLWDMDHVTVPGLGDLSDRLCIIPFNIDGMTAEEAKNRYEKENQIRICARNYDAYNKQMLDALSMPYAARLSACHYNTPKEIDEFLKATASFA